MRYEVYTLDMWGHVGADCPDHDCSCMVPDPDNAAEDAPKVHDDNACQCSEDCNQQFRRGTLTVPKDAHNGAILSSLGELGFTLPVGAEVEDRSDGPLDVNDAQGRRLLHLIPIEPMALRVPLVWRRTARYHERLRPHVHQDGRLESFADGGYPLYYEVTTPNRYHGASHDIACPKCATDLHEHGDDEATVTRADVNWEDPDLYCDCGERIPSAYAECDDCDNGPMTTPGLYHEPCTDPECTDTHLATCVTCHGKGSPLGEDERSDEHDAVSHSGDPATDH